MTLKQRLTKIHLYLIVFVLTNFIVTILFDIGIHCYLIFMLKVIIYLTGVTLFFMTIRPFKKLAMYFSVYILSPILILISWLMDGIFGAILGSIFLVMLYPPETKFKDGDYIFYEKFQGFLGTCCSYDITQNKFFILQKKVGEIRITEEHSFKESKFTVINNVGHLKLNMEVYNSFDGSARKVDTTLIINLN